MVIKGILEGRKLPPIQWYAKTIQGHSAASLTYHSHPRKYYSLRRRLNFMKDDKWHTVLRG